MLYSLQYCILHRGLLNKVVNLILYAVFFYFVNLNAGRNKHAFEFGNCIHLKIEFGKLHDIKKCGIFRF